MQPHPGRFSRINRLNNPVQFNQVFRSSCRSTDDTLAVIAKKNGLEYARIGLAISKKRIKLAVDRNRLKRLIRESFRKNQQQLAGLDVVVTTSRQAGRFDPKAVNESLQKHWRKLASCKEPS